VNSSHDRSKLKQHETEDFKQFIQNLWYLISSKN